MDAWICKSVVPFLMTSFAGMSCSCCCGVCGVKRINENKITLSVLLVRLGDSPLACQIILKRKL